MSRLLSLTPAHLARPAAEWLLWVAIAGIAYSQTFYFDVTIPNYPIGATGWPRAVAALIAIGATLQFLHKLAGLSPETEADADSVDPSVRPARIGQRIGIFGLPFLYLFVTPWIGFYVSTPIFVATLLLLLEVRSARAIAGVTLLVYGLVLVLFTRFFFVALPTGRIDAFYEINIAIIDFVRAGM